MYSMLQHDDDVINNEMFHATNFGIKKLRIAVNKIFACIFHSYYFSDFLY